MLLVGMPEDQPAADDDSGFVHVFPDSGSFDHRSPHWERSGRAPKLLRPLADRYLALAGGVQMWLDIVLHILGPMVVGFVIYFALGFGPGWILQTIFWVILFLLLLTSLLIAVECARAARFPEPPVRRELTDAELPHMAVVVAAYLPNETETILDSLRAHLAMDYPHDRHLVVCAYNTPHDLPIEDNLRTLARADARVLLLRVEGSTSKAENVEAALDLISDHVNFVGFFDADHQPHPSAARRVARWLSDAAGDKRFDMVQGQCQVRNVDDSFVTRTVAVEFVTMYAVAHPGRTVFNDFGIFGGSNGWWRSEVINELGMDRDMLTEDIDVSARALAQGYRLGTDPRVISTEEAPTTWSALWRQRMRWAQGWWEVSLRHTRALVMNHFLSGVQRRGVALLMGWRVLHPWIATQMVPLTVAMLLSPYVADFKPFLIFFLVTAITVLGLPFLQAGVARRLAPPGLRDRRWLFLRFALISTFFYSEFKAVTTRTAVTRDLLGTHTWEITPRTGRTSP